MPPWSQTVVVLGRIAPGASRVTGVRTDGGVVDLTVGRDGWVLGVTDGRILVLEALDTAGRILADAPVT